MMQKTKTITALDVAVTEALTLLTTIRATDYDHLTCAVEVATNALDQFAIKAKTHPNGTLQTIFSAGTDFTTPAGLIIDASGNLTTQAVGQGWFKMDIGGFYEVKLYAASGNAAGSVVDVFCGVR